MRPVDVNHVLDDTLRLVEYELKKARSRAERSSTPGRPRSRGTREARAGLPQPDHERDARDARGGRSRCAPCGRAPRRRRCRRTARPGRAPPSGEQPAGPFVTVHIADRAPGSRRAILARIFEPFFSTKGEGKGTGLGSTSPATSSLEHKGRIEVASAVGAGHRLHDQPSGRAPGTGRRHAGAASARPLTTTALIG